MAEALREYVPDQRRELLGPEDGGTPRERVLGIGAVTHAVISGTGEPLREARAATESLLDGGTAGA